MDIVIAGAGRLGRSVAELMLKEYHNVNIIDNNLERCRRISNALDTMVIFGDCTDINTLIKAGLRKCDVFIAVTGTDQDNLIACQIAAELMKNGKTIARANNPDNIDLFKTMGVDYVTCASVQIAKAINQEASVEYMHLIARIEETTAGIYTFTLKSKNKYVGKSLSDIKDMPKESLVISIVRKGKLIIPRGDTVLLADDKLSIVSTKTSVKHIEKIFK